jgi:hypothetical protein
LTLYSSILEEYWAKGMVALNTQEQKHLANDVAAKTGLGFKVIKV